MVAHSIFAFSTSSSDTLAALAADVSLTLACFLLHKKLSNDKCSKKQTILPCILSDWKVRLIFWLAVSTFWKYNNRLMLAPLYTFKMHLKTLKMLNN
jgi:hypothetical protein